MLRNERMWKWHEFVGICLCDLEMIKASKLGETVCKRGKKPVVFSCIHYLQVAICTVLFFSMTEVYFHISTFFTPFPIRKEKWHEENADEKKFCSQKRQTHSAIAKFQRFQMLNLKKKYIVLKSLLNVCLCRLTRCQWDCRPARVVHDLLPVPSFFLLHLPACLASIWIFLGWLLSLGCRWSLMRRRRRRWEWPRGTGRGTEADCAGGCQPRTRGGSIATAIGKQPASRSDSLPSARGSPLEGCLKTQIVEFLEISSR